MKKNYLFHGPLVIGGNVVYAPRRMQRKHGHIGPQSSRNIAKILETKEITALDAINTANAIIRSPTTMKKYGMLM